MSFRELLRSLYLPALGRRLRQVEEQQHQVALRFDANEEGLRAIQGELERLRDGQTALLEQRLAGVEQRLDAIEEQLAATSERLAAAEGRHDRSEEALRDAGREAARLRDEVVPAAVRRGDLLLQRLHGELEEVASLVERILRDEPLPVPEGAAADEAELAAALAAVQPALVEAFRGDPAEIGARLERHLPELAASPPVLDLGCGRGELLLMLREAGVPATGVDSDPALVQGALRRGLQVRQGDVLEVLRATADGAFGAVCAIHLFEHLPLPRLMAVLAELRRVLRPGGLLLAEGPNPRSLRVAASLHWLDPTHQHPLHPETLALLTTTAGFDRPTVDELHPFPDDQLLAAVPELAEPAADAAPTAVLALARRLDQLIHGHRDFVLRARTPARGGGDNPTGETP